MHHSLFSFLVKVIFNFVTVINTPFHTCSIIFLHKIPMSIFIIQRVTCPLFRSQPGGHLEGKTSRPLGATLGSPRPWGSPHLGTDAVLSLLLGGLSPLPWELPGEGTVFCPLLCPQHEARCLAHRLHYCDIIAISSKIIKIADSQAGC